MLDPRRAAFARSLGALLAELVWREIQPPESECEGRPGEAAPLAKGENECDTTKSLTRPSRPQDPAPGCS